MFKFNKKNAILTLSLTLLAQVAMGSSQVSIPITNLIPTVAVESQTGKDSSVDVHLP